MGTLALATTATAVEALGPPPPRNSPVRTAVPLLSGPNAHRDSKSCSGSENMSLYTMPQ